MEQVRSDLSSHTAEGYAYRVDLRLRPFGRAGELVPTARALMDYYRGNASLWEIQAALKMRPVAGNLKMGEAFLSELEPLLLERRQPGRIADSIDRMRRASVKSASAGLGPTLDVKSGTGGIRDVEFLVQGLQLIHGHDIPGILGGNTLAALDLLQEAGVLPESIADRLKEDYIFLRRTEHCLQILEDRQIHALPGDPAALRALARRMMGGHTETEQFMEVLDHTLERVHDAYRTYLLEKGGTAG
jgi:glutamate-ammonia-ligase adenylyltransferase